MQKNTRALPVHLTPDEIEKVDAAASAIAISRSAYLVGLIKLALDHGFTPDDIRRLGYVRTGRRTKNRI